MQHSSFDAIRCSCSLSFSLCVSVSLLSTFLLPQGTVDILAEEGGQ